MPSKVSPSLLDSSPPFAKPFTNAGAAKDEKANSGLSLFSPLKIKDLTFKNRLGVSPMCQYSCKNGLVNYWHVAHLGGFAIRGPGLIVIEASAVLPNGRITPQDAGYWSDDHAAAMKPVVEFCQSQGCKVGLQLAHAGRKASSMTPFAGKGHNTLDTSDEAWPNDIWGASSQPFCETAGKPKAMTKDQIRQVKNAYKTAAKRANDFGLDFIEIHAAHGYLFHNFYSPHSNDRKDEYGGSYDNRVRLLLETIEEVKSVWPASKQLWVRLSCTDWQTDDENLWWTPMQNVRLATSLYNLGVDVIDCSSGGNVSDSIPAVSNHYSPGFNVQFSKDIKASNPNAKTAVVGYIHESKHANEIIGNGDADIVLMARQFLRDASSALTFAKELNIEVDWPVQYGRSQ